MTDEAETYFRLMFLPFLGTGLVIIIDKLHALTASWDLKQKVKEKAETVTLR